MKLSTQIANQFREVQLNGHWVSTNLKTQLSDITWQQANIKIASLNTIVALTYHINYYVAGLNNLFEGGTLDIKDKYSFDHPPIQSNEDWQKLKQKSWDDAEKFASLVEAFTDEKLQESFVDEKYGNYHQNIQSMIQHSYYHLGQIVIIKKLIQNPANE